MARNRANAWAAAGALAAGGLIAFGISFIVLDTPVTVQYTRGAEIVEASDLPMPEDQPAPAHGQSYVFDYQEDMQYPELPTGCEATAFAVLAHINGIELDKVEFAEALPKSTGEDFVHAFWGDPTSEHGWATMAPCIVETGRRYMPTEKVAVDLTGTPLLWLPAPCAAWVTIDLDEPIASEYEQEGFSLLWNTHCVVILAADEATVTTFDPLKGKTVYPFSKFDASYRANGMQAVYIADRGYEPELG